MGNRKSSPKSNRKNSSKLPTVDNSKIPVSTDTTDRYGRENTNNWYYWEKKQTVVKNTFHASGQDFFTTNIGADVSIYNNWPKDIHNSSIFPYLLLNSADAQQFPEFCTFIKNWYQTSCAIVFEPTVGDRKVIGTGTLVKNGLIITARHNFQYIPTKSLYIRFFRYVVKNHDSKRLYVKESYLDLPVINKNLAKGGLDAGGLEFSQPLNKNLLSKYTKILPITKNLNSIDGLLPSGHYAMFHFAAGKPQISIGKIEDSDYYPYNEDINIHAGPGASGATIIWHAFDQTLGMGISVYRIHDNNKIYRRLISFAKFSQTTGHSNIIAPYNQFDFLPIFVRDLELDGYEFLQWSLNNYQGLHINHPSLQQNNPYFVAMNHSNHHIIPQMDLLYLWDYFHILDTNSETIIKNWVNNSINATRQKKHDKLNDSLAYFEPNVKAQERQIRCDEIEKKLKIERDKIYKAKYAEQLQTQYGNILTLMLTLPPFNRDDRTWFAWSFWNLFQGWKLSYRLDDPTNTTTSDYSEQTKPLLFPSVVWNCLKHSSNGLYHCIQEIKASPDPIREANVLSSLQTLTVAWQNYQQSASTLIHPYNTNEWDLVGLKDGHNLYKVKI